MEQLNRLRAAELDRIAPLFPRGARILEVGAGTGMQTLLLRQRGFDVTPIDVDSSDYAAHQVVPVQSYDGRTFPVGDASFDVVFSSNVLRFRSRG